jgi:hypothetical protein
MVLVGGFGIGSMGNSIVRAPFIVVIVSLAPVIYFIVKDFTFGTKPSDYGDEIHRSYALIMSYIVGAIDLIARVRDISYVYIIPKKFFRIRMGLEKIFVGGSVRSEAGAKQAASYKTNLMVNNAYDVSCRTEKTERRGKPTVQSLFVYMKTDHALEKKGGYWWTWRGVRSGDLATKEGVRVSSRLIAGNIIQAIIILYMILFTVYKTGDLVERYESLPECFVVRTVGSGVGWVIGGLHSLQNSSIVPTVADGAVDLFYNHLLPALDDLTSGSYNDLFSLMNMTQAEAMCSAASLYKEYLLEACTMTDDLAMACPGVNFLNGNVELLSTLCSGNSTLADMNASCFPGINATFDSAGLPSADTMKALVRVSLTRSIDTFISFLSRLFDSGIQYMNDIWVTSRTLQPWMFQMAFGIPGLLAFVAASILAASYFPSIVSTTLKFRSGVIPSLQDPNFARYRTSVHWVTLVLGGMFWVRREYVPMYRYSNDLAFSNFPFFSVVLAGHSALLWRHRLRRSGRDIGDLLDI